MPHPHDGIFGGLGLPPLIALAQSHAESVAVKIQEWPVPWQGTRDPDVAPDGRIWFVGQTGDYVATFNPDTEAFGKIELNEGAGPPRFVSRYS